MTTPTPSATPLSRSPGLLRIPEPSAALARLYGRQAMVHSFIGTDWRFRWLLVTGFLRGVTLHLNVGGARASVVLEDLAPFGAAIDTNRADFPAALRAAYLNGLGSTLWRQLEKLTQCAIEVIEVEPDSVLEADADGLGFEIRCEPTGVTTRGFLRSVDSGLERILSEASRREMPEASPRADLPIRWSAVVGHTVLPAKETRGLEEHDVVVIDDARYNSEFLECWLGAGPPRRYAGRVSVRNHRLHLIEFTPTGRARMTNPEADQPPAPENGCDDIPVNLRFELAQWQSSLGEMRALAAGAVIDLGQRIDDQTVTVWSDQHCIGKGQLVAVGERLGVRLLSLSKGHGG